MKKFFVSLVMLLSLSAACVFAQSSLIATLSHEGEITPFYGANALKEAHEAAVHGDAITLSSGTFIATDITKAITLRGAGMQLDTINNVLPTIIVGDFTIHIADSTKEKLIMEGIYNNHVITLKGIIEGARFIKSRFLRVDCADSSDGALPNSSFLHCKVVGELRLTDFNTDCNIINCYVHKLKLYDGGMVDGTNSFVQVFNSIIHTYMDDFEPNSSFQRYGNMAITNSILIGCNIEGYNYNLPGSGFCRYDKFPTSSTVYNCVAINSLNYAFENIPNETNLHSTYSEVFKHFTGTYKDEITFELTDEAKVKFLGLDGTQVGIYGGNIPFDPTTTNPYITKCNVAAKSTADGKLSVDIEVAGVE